MLRYYIICSLNNIIAIHKILDTANVCFLQTAMGGEFQGDKIVLYCVEVDDRGKKTSELMMYSYERGDVAITRHVVMKAGGRLEPI
jgi:hypothetical protein